MNKSTIHQQMISEFYYIKRQFLKKAIHIQNRENYTETQHIQSSIHIQRLQADVRCVPQLCIWGMSSCLHVTMYTEVYLYMRVHRHGDQRLTLDHCQPYFFR